MAKSEPAYAAMVAEFVNALMPFERDELEAGVNSVVLGAKSRRWPALGVVHAACERAWADKQEAKRLAEAVSRANDFDLQIEQQKPKRRDRSHLPAFLQNPRPPSTTEQRLCDYYRIQAFRQLNLYEVDEHGAYVWTPQAVAAEGDRRYHEATGRTPPEPSGKWW